ncbi:MAG TPA: glycosyltransferase [Acetobacteraceae bacterium]|jgi:glycosyltransferase involved in cell wall biosynthesis|nr:glycosyltransferase [Acetobacteraceae bacterium]
MAARLGIGIITCNRKDVLAETLARVREHTKAPVELVVADDGSGDGTDELVRARNIALVTGPNMGIAWNKNRALFLLAAIRQCDAIILLEDDSFPTEDGWEQSWVRAIQQWGHANLAGSWFRDCFLRGSGTVEDPVVSTHVSAQCSGFSRTALLYGGYFDSRFRGYGQEHVEHTRRLVRIGYGGTYEEIDGEVRPVYHLLQSGIQVTNPNSFSNQSDRDRNWLICRELLFDEAYRMPWRDDAEMMQFRAEIARAAP